MKGVPYNEFPITLVLRHKSRPPFSEFTCSEISPLTILPKLPPALQLLKLKFQSPPISLTTNTR